jgi:hypothetical protein
MLRRATRQKEKGRQQAREDSSAHISEINFSQI